jgi:hypothetical protein
VCVQIRTWYGLSGLPWLGLCCPSKAARVTQVLIPAWPTNYSGISEIIRGHKANVGAYIFIVMEFGYVETLTL